MHKEVEQKLVERWPLSFNTEGDVRHTAMSFGFTHGDGWFDILWRLCEDLEPLVAAFEQESGRQFEVLQVKEKFGGLRIYVSDADDAIRLRLEAAQQESFHTCEVCGQRGERREGGGREPISVAADATYGNGEFLQWLMERGIAPYMRTRDSVHRKNSPFYGPERFTYLPERTAEPRSGPFAARS